MKIHRLRLQHVKGVTDRTVDLPDAGVVVIEGPNEVGKSTFLEALDRLLDAKAKPSSRAAAIVSMQPVGEDVGPYVEAELSVGPYRLIFAKRWLKQPAATLRVLAPVPEQLSGEAALERMAAILDECLDRPLFDALRFAQAGPAGGIKLSDSSVLAAALDGAAGADLHTDEGADLLAVAEAEYRRYFTAGGKPTGELRRAMDDCTQAQDEAAETHRALAEAEQLLHDRDALHERVHGTEQTMPALRELRRAATVEVARLGQLRELEEAAAQSLAAASERLLHAEADWVRRESLVQEQANRAASVVVQHEALREAHARATQAEGQLASALRSARAAEQAYEEGQAASQVAVDAVSRLRATAEVVHLEERLARADRVSTALEGARRLLRAARVSPPVLREIEEVGQRLEVATAAVEASATSLTVHAIRGEQSVSIDGLAHVLSDGTDAIDHSVFKEAEILINDAVRIQVKPHADLARRAEHCERLSAELTERLSAVGATDVDHARVLSQEHGNVLAEISSLDRDLAVALSGSEGLEELRRHTHEQRVLLTGDGAGDGDAEEDVVDLAQARESAATSASRLTPLRIASAQARAEVEQAREATSLATSAREVARARHETMTAESGSVDGRLAQARDLASDDAVLQARAARHHAQDVATSAHREIRAELALAHADEADARLRLATSHCERADRELEDLRGQAHEIKGRLEMTAGEGRQEVDDRAGQVFTDAKRGLASVGRRARAARQLYRTLVRHRDAAHASYAAPYATVIEGLGAAVYGESFGVQVSSDLTITHRHLHGATVAFEHLSGGAKEQLGVLARVAVAVLVEQDDQAVPVVIDDGLGYTDPDRLQRLSEVLARTTHSAQIILLTCTPQRYAGIGGAHTITLSA